ncbi:MAG: Lrp/AsnC family transcriptional regulator [Candidatus Heimdallarchaeota archaeon]
MNFNNNLDELDTIILKELYDIPLEADPIHEMAKQLKISKEQLLTRIERLLEIGIIRRIAPVVNHRRAGYVHNAMVLLQTTGEELQKTAKILVEQDFISHLFRRDNQFGFDLYCMIHGRSNQEISSKLTKIQEICPNTPMIWSESTKELKKTSLGILE